MSGNNIKIENWNDEKWQERFKIKRNDWKNSKAKVVDYFGFEKQNRDYYRYYWKQKIAKPNMQEMNIKIYLIRKMINRKNTWKTKAKNTCIHILVQWLIRQLTNRGY